MSKKIHSQDSNSDIEWDMNALYDSFRDAADDYEQVMKQLEDEEEDKEETEDMEEQLEIANEIELPGFEEYEETRMKLDMKSSVVNGNIKITIMILQSTHK